MESPAMPTVNHTRSNVSPFSYHNFFHFYRTEFQWIALGGVGSSLRERFHHRVATEQVLTDRAFAWYSDRSSKGLMSSSRKATVSARTKVHAAGKRAFSRIQDVTDTKNLMFTPEHMRVMLVDFMSMIPEIINARAVLGDTSWLDMLRSIARVATDGLFKQMHADLDRDEAEEGLRQKRMEQARAAYLRHRGELRLQREQQQQQQQRVHEDDEHVDKKTQKRTRRKLKTHAHPHPVPGHAPRSVETSHTGYLRSGYNLYDDKGHRKSRPTSPSPSSPSPVPVAPSSKSPRNSTGRRNRAKLPSPRNHLNAAESRRRKDEMPFSYFNAKFFEWIKAGYNPHERERMPWEEEEDEARQTGTFITSLNKEKRTATEKAVESKQRRMDHFLSVAAEARNRILYEVSQFQIGYIYLQWYKQRVDELTRVLCKPGDERTASELDLLLGILEQSRESRERLDKFKLSAVEKRRLCRLFTCGVARAGDNVFAWDVMRRNGGKEIELLQRMERRPDPAKDKPRVDWATMTMKPAEDTVSHVPITDIPHFLLLVEGGCSLSCQSYSASKPILSKLTKGDVIFPHADEFAPLKRVQFTALEDVIFGVIDEKAFMSTFSKRLEEIYNEKLLFLRSLQVFKAMPLTRLEALASSLRELQFRGGDVILSQGDINLEPGAFIIKKGTVIVYSKEAIDYESEFRPDDVRVTSGGVLIHRKPTHRSHTTEHQEGENDDDVGVQHTPQPPPSSSPPPQLHKLRRDTVPLSASLSYPQSHSQVQQAATRSKSQTARGMLSRHRRRTAAAAMMRADESDERMTPAEILEIYKNVREDSDSESSVNEELCSTQLPAFATSRDQQLYSPHAVAAAAAASSPRKSKSEHHHNKRAVLSHPNHLNNNNKPLSMSAKFRRMMTQRDVRREQRVKTKKLRERRQRETHRLMEVNHLGEHTMFGEQSLFSSTPRSASVVSKGRTIVYQIARSDFNQHVDENTKQLMKRLMKYNEHKTIAELARQQEKWEDYKKVLCHVIKTENAGAGPLPAFAPTLFEPMELKYLRENPWGV